MTRGGGSFLLWAFFAPSCLNSNVFYPAGSLMSQSKELKHIISRIIWSLENTPH